MNNKIIILLVSLVLLIVACESPVNPETEIVYITETGTKYHRDGCQYLSSSKIAITLSEACNKGYSPCSICNPPACK